METFKSFVESKGLLFDDATPEEIQNAKVEFKKLKNKSRRQELTKKWSRLEILLLKEEKMFFKRVAKSYKMALGPFIKEAAQMYLKQGFIHPNKEEVQALELQIRRIGNNVNQIAHKANSNKHVSQKMMKQLQNQLNELEDEVSQLFRKPLSVELLVETYIRDKPEAVPTIESIINRCKHNDNQNNETQNKTV